MAQPGTLHDLGPPAHSCGHPESPVSSPTHRGTSAQPSSAGMNGYPVGAVIVGGYSVALTTPSLLSYFRRVPAMANKSCHRAPGPTAVTATGWGPLRSRPGPWEPFWVEGPKVRPHGQNPPVYRSCRFRRTDRHGWSCGWASRFPAAPGATGADAGAGQAATPARPATARPGALRGPGGGLR